MSRRTLSLNHPREATLNRYVDGEADAGENKRVAAHLIKCQSCRAFVSDARRLREAAIAIPVDALPDGTLAKILARRAAGERIILPDATPLAPPRTSLAARIAVAAAIIVVAGGLALVTQSNATAAGEYGALTFSPAKPRAGDSISITYQAPPWLASDSLLFLRARFAEAPLIDRVSSDARRTTHRFPLHRVRDGVFAGAFRLPREVVYATMAVEDSLARRVDHNDRHLWAISTHDGSGRITFTALEAAASSGVSRRWEARYVAARELVRLYPDSSRAWHGLGFLQSVVHGEGDTSNWNELRRQFVHFDSIARRTADTQTATASTLLWFAKTLRDTAATQYWRRELVARAPADPLAVQERVIQALPRRFTKDPRIHRQTLDKLEIIWNEVGPAHQNVLNVGLQTAVQTGDVEAIRRWGQRYLDGTTTGRGRTPAPTDRQDAMFWVGEEWARFPALRREGLDLLRRLLAPRDLVDASFRPLWQTVDDAQRSIDGQRGNTLQLIGDALFVQGDSVAALDSLRASAALGWSLSRFRSTASAALLVGDTTEAARQLALVQLDPNTDRAFADTARRMLGPSISNVKWTTIMSAAHDSLQRRVRGMSMRKSLRRTTIELTDAHGTVQTFADFAQHRVTVVAFGLELARNGLVDADSMQRLQRKLDAMGAHVVAVAYGPYTRDASRLVQERGLTYDVVFDRKRDAERAFEAYGIPMYFVVDAGGNIRFAFSDPSQLLVQASVLTSERKLAANPQ